MVKNYINLLPRTTAKIIDINEDQNLNKYIKKEFGSEVLEFLSRHAPTESSKTFVTLTNNIFNIATLYDSYFKAIVNLNRINDINRINKFLEAVNNKLPLNGLYIGCVETKSLRKQRILRKYPVGLAHLYYVFDFIFKRIFPKLPLTKYIYFKLTGGRNRVLSRTETIGRLYSCGFSMVEERFIGNHLYFVAKKETLPVFDQHPSYGPIYKMRRIGKEGKTIYVYKIRTMHAYAEYLQQYVYERNSLQEGGKFKDDFRVSTLGKFFRKYWLDELPMLINFFKGDLKLVGIRPLSKHYLSLYSEDIRQKRLMHKPGLIPPFYADMPKTLEQIISSEMKYLTEYENSPFTTDLKYFSKALYNILIKKARSK